MSEAEIQYILTCAKHITQLISKIGQEHITFEEVVPSKSWGNGITQKLYNEL